jgi:hypothetical protein
MRINQIAFSLVLLFVLSASCKMKKEDKTTDQKTVVKGFHANGKIRYEMELLDSIPHGSMRSYTSDGRLEKEENYFQSKLRGAAKYYYESGKLRSEVTYDNDTLHGPSTYYFESGNKEYEGDYYRGYRVGVHKVFFDDTRMQEKMVKEYLIYHKEEVLNTYQVYDTSGVLTKQDAHLEIVHKSDKKELTIKVLNKEFDKIQAVIGNFDFRYTLHPGAKVDTIRSLNNTTVVIPIQDDTVRGYVENFEWTQSNRGVSRGLFFCYPAKWRTTDGK